MTDYRDAVKALASSITSTKTGLSDEKKMGIARNILSRKSLDRRDIDIDISDEKDFQVLRDYLGSLQRARRANMGAEIEDSIDNAKRLSALRDQLEEDLSEAYDEDKELESIAQRLQDKGLGKVAGKEESQINDLGTSLEKLVNKGKEVDKLEETLENVLSEHGLEKNKLDEELRRRAKTVSRLISEYGKGSGDGSSSDSDSGPDISEPWQLVAKDPGNEPDWTKNSTDIWKGDWGWMHTTPRGSVFNWMVNKGPTANQGWKIHVAVDPDNEDEVLRVAETVMPVLNSIDSDNKFARNAGSLKNKGGETAVKLVTIYPKEDSSVSDVVNQNRQTTENIIGELINALDAEGLLSPSAIVKTIGEFNVSKDSNPTRIFVRYDKLGGDEVEDIDGNVFGGRKPGAVPEGMSTSSGKDLDKHDVSVLPGLKSPSFDIYLPVSNYDR